MDTSARGRAGRAVIVTLPNHTTSSLTGQSCSREIVMTAIIRKFGSPKSDVEPSSTGEGVAGANRPAPPSNLGLRVINPRLDNAVIE